MPRDECHVAGSRVAVVLLELDIKLQLDDPAEGREPPAKPLGGLREEEFLHLCHGAASPEEIPDSNITQGTPLFQKRRQRRCQRSCNTPYLWSLKIPYLLV